MFAMFAAIQTVALVAAVVAPAPMQERDVPPDSSGIPSRFQQRLSQGPISRAEAEMLVREVVGMSARRPELKASPGRSPSWVEKSERESEQESEQESSQETELGWLLAMFPSVSRHLDEELLLGGWGRLERSGDQRLSFLELREHAPISLERFRSLDSNGSGSVEFDEFAVLTVRCLTARGWTFQAELVELIGRSLVRTAKDLTEGGQDFARPPVLMAPPEGQSTVRIDLADQIARALYPLPSPRLASGRGWGTSGAALSMSGGAITHPDRRAPAQVEVVVE